jgi:glycosyltransferase involved in cell wall biosynthesis
MRFQHLRPGNPPAVATTQMVPGANDRASSATPPRVVKHPAARIYGSIRTAHLERLDGMAPSIIIYNRRRYDFDASAAPEGARLLQLGRLATVMHLLRHGYETVEVNEPVWSNRWLDVTAQVAAVRARRLLMRRRTTIVTYCIGNMDPIRSVRARRPKVPGVLVTTAARLFMKALCRSIDRLAFGTSGSFDVYADYVSRSLLEEKGRIFEAIPAPCTCLLAAARTADHGSSKGARLLFVGAFSDRKGIRQLMDTWDRLPQDKAGMSLRLVGKGPLTEVVKEWTQERPEVELVVDPPRTFIHESLRNAEVLILLSQPLNGWREQVGLPIVEGLSHGCRIVTTTETGLAPWLGAHGHVVLPVETEVPHLARLLVTLKDQAWSRSGSLGHLPEMDQRLAADAWLFEQRS